MGDDHLLNSDILAFSQQKYERIKAAALCGNVSLTVCAEDENTINPALEEDALADYYKLADELEKFVKSKNSIEYQALISNIKSELAVVIDDSDFLETLCQLLKDNCEPYYDVQFIRELPAKQTDQILSDSLHHLVLASSTDREIQELFPAFTADQIVIIRKTARILMRVFSKRNKSFGALCELAADVFGFSADQLRSFYRALQENKFEIKMIELEDQIDDINQRIDHSNDICEKLLDTLISIFKEKPIDPDEQDDPVGSKDTL